MQEQGMSNSRAAIEVWEGSGQDAHNAVVHHLNLSIHRVETLQGNLPLLFSVFPKQSGVLLKSLVCVC